jgi:hypothetical protein
MDEQNRYMRDVIPQFVFIAIMLLSMSSIALADPLDESGVTLLCAMQITVDPGNASNTDLSECYDVYNFTANSPGDDFSYKNGTLGYCCGVQEDSPNQGNFTRAYCLEQGGTFTAAEKASNLQEACAPGAGQVTKRFTGTVFNASNDARVANAQVNVTYEYKVDNTVRTKSDNVTANSTGQYLTQFTVPETAQSRISPVKAVKGRCEQTRTIPTSPDPVRANLTICDAPGDEDPEPPGDTPVCGNGVLEEGERCEPMGSQPANFSETVPDVPNRVCLDNCQVKYQDESCDDQDVCTPECCQGPSPQCLDENNNPKPVCQAQLCSNPSLPTYTANTNKSGGIFTARIGWTPRPDGCGIAYSNIEITGPNGQTLTSETINDDSTSYSYKAPFDDLNDSETYEATVTTKYVSGAEVTNQTTFTPTFICAGRQNTAFCTTRYGKNGYMACDGLESDFNPCGDQACVNLGEQGATCQTTRCQRCSGPVSLFSSTSLQPPGDSEQCNIAYQQNLCYYEAESQRSTVRGQATSCGEITSCSDYESRQSCTQTPCDNQAAANCEWTSLNQGLGEGFCSPTDADDVTPSLCQQCGFDGCTEQLCQETIGNISGNSQSFCYFNEAYLNPDGTVPEDDPHDNYRCMAKPDSGCETYDDKTSCLGPTSNRSDLRLNPDYTRESSSNDYFNFGVCDWDEATNRCYKDADDDESPDCGIPGNLNETCVRDVNPPETTIGGVSDGANITSAQLDALTVTASDDESDDASLETHIKYDDNPLFDEAPKTQLVNAIQTSPANKIDHTFTYWSQDPNENIEPKQTHQITVYPDLDKVLSLSATSNLHTEGGTTYSNITAEVGSLPSNDTRTLTCTFRLRQDGSVLEEAGDSDPQTTTGVLPYLQSGYYTVNASCHTDKGDTYSEEQTIRVDTDLSITNTTPSRETVRAGDITLTAETDKDRRCQYQPYQTNDWANFAETGGQYHETTVTRDAADGIVTHDVRCTNNTEWIQGDNEDTIMYAVDDEPPQLSIDVTKDGEPVSTDTPINADYVEATVNCNDQPPLTYQNNNYSFGCAEPLQYCQATNTEECTPSLNGQPVPDDPIIIEPKDNRSLAKNKEYPEEALYILRQDKGNNNQTFKAVIDVKPSYDLTPPNTTLNGLPRDQLIMPDRILDAELQVTDNNDTADEITTFVQYAGETHSEPNNLGWLKSQMQENPNNTHTFKYWSEDTADNTEDKDEATVQLYTDYDDELSLTLTPSLYNQDQDTYGRIQANVGSLPPNDDRGVTCQFTYQNTTKTAEGNTAAETTFNELPEGLHSITANCTGAKQSSFTATKNAEIDLSPTIQNTTPYYDPARPGQITISADTTQDRTCEYQRNGWRQFTQTGGTTHTANITTQPGDGIVTHDVRCSDNEETWIYGGKTDKIAYGVDGDGPRTNITVTDPDGNTRSPDLPIIADVVNVGFTCQDRPEKTKNGEPIRFGCAEIKYVCSGTAENPCTPTSDDTNVTSGTYQLEAQTNQERTETVSILARDQAGNTQTTTHEVNLVDDSLDLNVEIQPR